MKTVKSHRFDLGGFAVKLVYTFVFALLLVYGLDSSGEAGKWYELK